MRLKIDRVIFTILFIASVSISNSQSHTYVVRDLQSWSELEAKFKANKSLSFGLSESLRLDRNSSQYEQLFTNVYAGYKFSKAFRVKAGFRVINEGEDEADNSNHLRYFASAQLKHSASDFTFKHRLMYTNKNEWGISKKEGDDFIHNFRYRGVVEYNIKKWKPDPYASVEVFRKVKEGDAAWDKVRFKLGTDFKIKSLGEIGAFYGIEKEFGLSLQPTTYILGLNYTYTFKLY